MNRSEWKFITIGCIACICNGGMRLALAIVLTKLITYFLFACSGEALTKRLRSKIFHTILRQEIGYFDDPNNNTGALCTRLATEASAVQSATGIRIGLILQSFASLGVGIIVAFVFSWQFTLVILGFVPLLIVGGLLKSYLITGFSSKDKKLFEDVGKVTVESIQNIRTVVQLTKEDHFYEKYCSFLEIPYQCLGCILFGAQSVGKTVSMSPNYTKAVHAAEKIFEFLNRKPIMDNSSRDGDEIVSSCQQMLKKWML
ncbi:unnamed protein product, partial [Rotaria sp. Silwood1]